MLTYKRFMAREKPSFLFFFFSQIADFSPGLKETFLQHYKTYSVKKVGITLFNQKLLFFLYEMNNAIWIIEDLTGFANDDYGNNNNNIDSTNYNIFGRKWRS